MPQQATTPISYVPPRLPSPIAKRTPSEPIVRAQIADAKPPLRIPTPEELGIGSPHAISADTPLDWNMVERKLDSAGVTSYQMERTGTGFRFTCKLATRLVAGSGSNRNEAVRNTLDQLTH